MGDSAVVPGVTATPAALAAITELIGQRGPLMFFQSGGCCDGSLPMCFDDGELVIGDHDVLLGRVGGCPFYIDHRQYEAWKHTQLILDVGAGEPEGFSLPAGEDRHFVISSRVFDDDELTTRARRDLPDMERPVPSDPRRLP
jgi:uncharacterized protein (DUF779 family)